MRPAAEAAFPGDAGRIIYAAGSSIRSVQFNGADLRQQGQGADPAYSPDGRQIVFAWFVGDDYEIFVKGSDGSSVRQLTDNNVNDVTPTFSPDGERIVFRTEQGGAAGLFIMDAAGSNRRRLTTGDDRNPEFFPDGETIIFERRIGGDIDIMKVGVDGGAVQGVVTGANDDADPTVSPEGTKIAFERRSGAGADIRVANANGGAQSTVGTGNNNFAPGFSPHAGGVQIVFRRSVGSSHEIWRMNSDGSAEFLVDQAAGPQSAPNWGPEPPPRVVFDITPPPVTSQTTATFALSAPTSLLNGRADGFRCRLDGAPFQNCASLQIFTGLADGQHRFDALGFNDTGEGEVRSFSWRVDTQPPDTEITSRPANRTRQARPTFRFSSSEEGSSFECAFDEADFAPCSAAASHRPAVSLADGKHTFRVRAVDQAGNADPTPVSATFTVDTKAPNVTLTKKPKGKLQANGSRARARFAFRASERPVRFECALAGKGVPKRQRRFRRCSSPLTLKLKPGKYTFKVRARDAAGNLDRSPARHRLRVVR